MYQAEGLVIILVRRLGAVCVVNDGALALGVVINIGDERRCSRRAAKVHPHLLEQVCFVVGRAIDAAVRRGDCGWTIERIVGCAAGEGSVVWRGILPPVYISFVGKQQITPATLQIPLEVVFLTYDHASAVEDLKYSR